MTESVNAENPQEITAEGAAAPTGPGQMLRQARTEQGMPLESLAAALKVPVEKLRALEAEDWQALPDVVFARSLTMSVCRILNLPAQPVLELLPQLKGSRLSNKVGINEPVRHRAVPSALTGSGAQLGRRLALLLALLVAAGALTYGAWQWQEGSAQRDAERAQESADASVAAPELAQATAQAGADVRAQPNQPLFAPGQVPVDAPLESEEAAAASAAAPSAPAAAAAAATTTAATAGANAPAATPVGQGASAAAATAPAAQGAADQAAPSTAAADAAAQPTAAGKSALRVRATAEVWVQVRDADARLVSEKILKANEVLDASGRRPLSVVIGKADATQVEIDGVAFDVRAKARDNVARFEVK